jgi:hypothetical protein
VGTGSREENADFQKNQTRVSDSEKSGLAPRVTISNNKELASSP